MPADEVDQLVEAWRRERPDLDLGPAGGVQPGHPARPAPRPGPPRRLRRSTGSRLGVRRARALRRAGAPYELSPGRLLARDPGDQRHDDQPGRPAGSAAAWSSALPDPDDRRGVIVRLTADRQAARRRARWPTCSTASARCSAGWAPASSARLADSLRRAARAVRRADRPARARGLSRRPRRLQPLQLERLAARRPARAACRELAAPLVVGAPWPAMSAWIALLGAGQLRSCRSIRASVLARLADLRRPSASAPPLAAPVRLGAAAPLLAAAGRDRRPLRRCAQVEVLVDAAGEHRGSRRRRAAPTWRSVTRSRK